MKNFVFALASVTSLAGFVAGVAMSGCSSSDPSPVAPTDSGVDTGKTPPKTPITGDDDGGSGADKTCLTDKEVDATSIPYKSPTVTPGACDPAIIDTIEKFAKDNPNGTFEDLKAEIAKESDGCAKCVFSADGATWAPIIEADGKVTNVNVGGCIEIASGKADCGKAYQQWDSCLDEACQSCSDSDVDQCNQDAQQDGAACGKASAALETACGANVNDFIGKCYKAGQLIIDGPITAQCIGTGIKDAGSD